MFKKIKNSYKLSKIFKKLTENNQNTQKIHISNLAINKNRINHLSHQKYHIKYLCTSENHWNLFECLTRFAMPNVKKKIIHTSLNQK